MGRFRDFTPAGVIPATLLAFADDLAIDEAETKRHLRHVAATRGVAAITVNGHSSEVHACTADEQRRILALSAAEIGDRVPLVNGIYADGSLEAAGLARMAAAEASDLPIIVFQYPATTGLGYPLDTLLRLVAAVPSIRAIKDWCADPMLHERHIRTLQALPRPVNVLTTHSAWLMSSLAMGAAGLLSGAGSVVADLQVALFEAVRANDLARARRINDRLYPLQQAFYAPPFLDMHNRMKECLVLLGRQARAVVRPPLVKLGAAEIARLRAALDQAGIRPEGARAEAAE